MKAIVFINNDPKECNDLKCALEREGFRTFGADNGKDALALCLRVKPDLIILDVDLPDCDGFEVCKTLQLNSQLAAIPIIFLTDRNSESDRVMGLELGAKDYISKPFFARELIARIKAHTRKTTEENHILKAGKLEMNRQSCQVKVGDKVIALTATEFNLLEHLMSNPGIVFKRSQIIDAVWGYQRVVSERTVDVFMLRLRRKLGIENSTVLFLNSVRGFGYRFDLKMAEATFECEEGIQCPQPVEGSS